MGKKFLARLAAFLLSVVASLSAQQIQVTLDPAQTRIDWTLSATMHTVHGTFKLSSGIITFDPASGNASGEIIVSAASGESGNTARDSKMHKEVLESNRYPEITFVPRHVLGKLAEQGSSNLQVQGVFHIHGADHDMTLPITVTRTGSAVKATSSFKVPYQDWGMKNPSNMLLHVDGHVELSVNATGQWIRRL
jgi:polyisoprenoid-binding protein YceI